LRGLTRRQEEILKFIEEYYEKNGFPPSIRDISKKFKITPRGAVIHLVALERKGYVKRTGKARGIKLVYRSDAIKLPIVEKMPFDMPVNAVENAVGFLSVPRDMLEPGRDHFVYKVKDDSLKEENVMKGDYLVIKRQREAENGDIVIVVREGTDLEVLKYTDGGNIGKLVKTGDIRIVGKAIGLIRLFR